MNARALMRPGQVHSAQTERLIQPLPSALPLTVLPLDSILCVNFFRCILQKMHSKETTETSGMADEKLVRVHMNVWNLFRFLPIGARLDIVRGNPLEAGRVTK